MKSRSKIAARLSRHPFLAVSVTALLFCAPQKGRSAAKAYTGVDNSSWNTAGNWSPSGVPGNGDDASLGTTVENATTNLDVTFNGSYSVTALNSLTLNSSGLHGYMILNQTATSSIMAATTENIGTTTSENTYNQSAGSNTVNVLNIGVNSIYNTYNLSGSGSLYADYFQVGENIGVSGTGVFNQSGGTNTVSSDNNIDGSTLTLGVNTAGNGTYNLSSGTLNADFEQIGAAGTGVFTQTGGTNTTNVSLTIGGGTAGGTGTYSLSGGTLNATGGNGFILQAGGTFNLSGGTFNASLVQTGGTFNLLSGGSYDGSLMVSGGLVKLGGGTYGPDVMLTLQAGGVLELNGYGVNSSNYQQVLAGTVMNGASANSTYNALEIYQTAGTIQDGSTGKLSLVLGGGGTTSSFAGNNTYSGSTTVGSSSVVQAASAGGFSPNSAYILTTYDTLDANGFNVTLGSLAGTGGTVKVGTGSITSGSDGTSTSYTGTLTGTGAFNKVGYGTFTLNGGSLFTGTIDVQAGGLSVGAVNGIPVASTVVIGNGSILNVAYSQSLASLASGALSAFSFTSNPTLTIGSGNTSTTLGTNFTGGGTLVKTGTGTLTLGFGPYDSNVNTDTGLAITVNAGQVTLSQAAGTNAVAAALNINGGSVVLAASEQIADASVVTLSAGTFNLAGYNETIGGLTGSGTTTLGGGTLTVTQSSTTAYPGSLVGPGSFIKGGSGTLTVSGASGFGGTFTVNAGQLTLQGTVSSTGLTANSGATLLLSSDTVSLGGGSLLANAGGTVQYSGATISNGYLRGSGTQSLLSGSTNTFNGVTTYNSTVIAQNGPAFFNNFTNGGTLNNGAVLTFNGGINEFSGIINVNSTLNTQDFSTGGVMTVANGATVSNGGSNFVAGGGSRTTINSGGTLSTASGTSIELNGALLVNNGTQNGLLDVNYGSTARGSGVFGTVSVGTGGKFGNNGVDTGGGTSAVAAFRRAPALSRTPTPFVGPQLSTAPGTITVGGLLLGAGSNLGVNVQNATGAAGSGYDTIHDLGALTLTGNSTPGNQVTISVASLNANGNPGAAANFNAGQAYQFALVTADGGITGFSADEFAVDTSGFANSLGNGSFFLAQNGNVLDLDFTPVPEPATWLAGGLISLLGFITLWRQVRSQQWQC